MRPDEWRYLIVALILSAGVACGWAALLGPMAFASYMVAFYLTYMNTTWLISAIERIANGKGNK